MLEANPYQVDPDLTGHSVSIVVTHARAALSSYCSGKRFRAFSYTWLQQFLLSYSFLFANTKDSCLPLYRCESTSTLTESSHRQGSSRSKDFRVSWDITKALCPSTCRNSEVLHPRPSTLAHNNRQSSHISVPVPFPFDPYAVVVQMVSFQHLGETHHHQQMSPLVLVQRNLHRCSGAVGAFERTSTYQCLKQEISLGHLRRCLGHKHL